MQKKIVHFLSPGSCKYPDFEAFHLFQTSETDECHLCQLLSAHTLIQTHSHTHTGSDQCRRLHTLLFYFGCVDKRAGPCPNMVNGAVERSGSPANRRRDWHRRSSV